MSSEDPRRWIVTNEPVRFSEDGTIISGGAVGWLGVDNVYLTTYAEYKWRPDGTLADKGEPAVRHTDLKVGEHTSARFSLSGESAVYEVWRVK